ncbi:MAG: cytochrome c3 family protein [bacterium]|nr:cytochrome c3 family protein [bacterium]
MRFPKRTLVLLSALCALVVVLGATAAGLYDYTPDELTGPEQPIEFNHQIHAGARPDGNLGIDCLYCHSAADKSQHATVPAVSVCLGCHNFIKEGRTEGSAGEIAKIHEYYGKGESIPWVKIHNLPEHVQFKHYRHVESGVACQTCHGSVEEMKRVYLTEDTRYTARSLYLPTAKLEMGWCMECHLESGAPDDCAACHH